MQVSKHQIATVQSLVIRQGLKARGIIKLNHPDLSGLRENNIQRIISGLGLVDPEWSQRLKGSTQLPKEQKQQLAAYLRERAELPDSQVALDTGISKNVVVRLRLQVLGKHEGQRRISTTIEERRRKNVSRGLARKRRQRYCDLLALKASLQNSADTPQPRQCKICSETWPETEDFFPRRKSPDGLFFSRTCVICEAEIGVMKRSGKTQNEITEWTRSGIWRPACRTVAELTAMMPAIAPSHPAILPSEQEPARPTAVCHKCGRRWLHNANFFQMAGRQLLHICLVCPNRRFTSK